MLGQSPTGDQIQVSAIVEKDEVTSDCLSIAVHLETVRLPDTALQIVRETERFRELQKIAETGLCRIDHFDEAARDFQIEVRGFVIEGRPTMGARTDIHHHDSNFLFVDSKDPLLWGVVQHTEVVKGQWFGDRCQDLVHQLMVETDEVDPEARAATMFEDLTDVGLTAQPQLEVDETVDLLARPQLEAGEAEIVTVRVAHTDTGDVTVHFHDLLRHPFVGEADLKVKVEVDPEVDLPVQAALVDEYEEVRVTHLSQEAPTTHARIHQGLLQRVALFHLCEASC